MVGSKVASDIELILTGGAGCVMSRFVGSNWLPAGAENVGSIFANALSTAEAYVLVGKGVRGEGRERQREGESISEDHRKCLHL